MCVHVIARMNMKEEHITCAGLKLSLIREIITMRTHAWKNTEEKHITKLHITIQQHILFKTELLKIWFHFVNKLREFFYRLVVTIENETHSKRVMLYVFTHCCRNINKYLKISLRYLTYTKYAANADHLHILIKETLSI